MHERIISQIRERLIESSNLTDSIYRDVITVIECDRGITYRISNNETHQHFEIFDLLCRFFTAYNIDYNWSGVYWKEIFIEIN